MAKQNTPITTGRITTMIFKAGNYYIADYVGNVSGPYVSRDAAIKDSVTGDTILIALTPDFIKTKVHKKKSVNEITLDFTQNLIIIEGDEGAEAVLNKVTYPVGTNAMPVEESEDWEVLVEDSFKLCKNTTIIGNPPVEGECLDEMLHM